MQFSAPRNFLAVIALSLASMGLSVPSAQAAASADLAVRFTAVSFRNGSVGLYTVTVTSKGPGATDAPVTTSLSLPDGFYLVSGGGNGFICAAAAGRVECTHAMPFPSGTSTSFQIRVGVCSPFTRVSTTVRITYAGDAVSSNNSYTRITSVRQGPCQPSPTATTALTATPTPTVTLGSPAPALTGTPTPSPTATRTPVPAVTDLKLTKTSIGSAYVGRTYNYTLYVANLGSAATNSAITVTDALPTGLSFVTGSGAGWICTASGQLVTCTYTPALAAAATTTLTLTVNVGSAAYPTITNSATASYPGDSDATNNTGTRPTSVRQ